MDDDIVSSLDRLETAVTLSTQVNRVLPSPAPVPAIPTRDGFASCDPELDARWRSVYIDKFWLP